MEKYKFVGLDVHKETIAVSVAEAAGGEVRYEGEILNTADSVVKLVRRLRKGGAKLSFCYEAGLCGYGLHRQLQELGQDCQVVAPSLIPRKPGDRVKTDRRDSLNLARLHRAGELTAVWVPDGAQEALRDLTRAREDMKHIQLQAKQRLLGFLLRHGKRFEGKDNWTQARFYLPQYGRFTAPDPARDQHFEDTQSWNIYSYVRNSPILSTDPTGMVGEGNVFTAGTTVAYNYFNEIVNDETKKQTNCLLGTDMGTGAQTIGAIPGYPETGATAWRSSNDKTFIDAVNTYNSRS